MITDSMKAMVLVRTGKIRNAFELREVPVPAVPDNGVLIKVRAFGLNYADAMAIKGNYQDAPPLPSIIGYDVYGQIVAMGKDCSRFAIGDTVTALCRFGGYAEYAATDERAVVKVPPEVPICKALALATQAATAWYCTEEATTIYPGERVVVTAAAGGVGSLIVQLAKKRGAKVYGVVGNERRAAFLNGIGASGILYRDKGDVFEQYRAIEGKKAIDIMYDSAAGSYIRKGMRDLSYGGRFVGFGISQANNARHIGHWLKFALSCGIFHPLAFLMKSQSFTGVNMLKLADHKPYIVQKCMHNAVEAYVNGDLHPLEGKLWQLDQLEEAHIALQAGSYAGKMAVAW